MKDPAVTNDPPTRAYARLLLRLHDLIAKGQGDGPDADAVRDQMDAPWYAMTQAEQERMGGLSEELYAHEEGCSKLKAPARVGRLLTRTVRPPRRRR